MPVSGPLPQTGDQQDINADADRCFRARSPRNWVPHDIGGTDDYGLDYQVQTKDGYEVTDIFRVQLKGTRAPEISVDGEFISIQFKASTIRYYDRIVEPILLVVCRLDIAPEPVDCALYFVWVRDELNRIGIANLPQEQQYVSLRVPVQNRLTTQTDLSADLHQQNELSRAGHALDVRVEQTHPGFDVEERVSVVQGMTQSIGSRSAAFIDVLAAPAEEHWINPPPGTLAWQLNQTKELLRTGSLDRVSDALDLTSKMLDGATHLELAEYWFLRGKWHTASSRDKDASDTFWRAYDASHSGKHLAAWVEAELRVRYDGSGPKPYPDLLAALVGTESAVLSAKSRVLAAEGRFEESLQIADEIAGAEGFAARALARTISSKPAEALKECESGLLLSPSDTTRQLLLVLRASAKFSLAEASTPVLEEHLLPPSGPAGIDSLLVRNAWDAIGEAIEVLRLAGWSANIEHIAGIWAATASMLGKQQEVLPGLSEAARARPYFENVQVALEAIAAQCGDFATALEANNRVSPSQTRNLRRVVLLHEAQKHGDCFRYFEANFESFDRTHKLFGHASIVAALSAHKLAQPELVKKWAAALEADNSLSEHAALLQYFLAQDLNPLGNDAALQTLVAKYDELGRPFTMGVAILQELDPTDSRQAIVCVDIAERVRRKVEPSPAMAAHVALALVTMKKWQDLLSLCTSLKVRLHASPRMLAFEALALDQLGQTDEARALLEQMLAGGIVDSLALNTYVVLMVRCGYVQEALQAAERILERATSKKQRVDCIRLLFNLVQRSNPTSNRLLALAIQMSTLADPDSEIEEGIYLVMFLVATMTEANAPSREQANEFKRRSEKFFARFPDSKMLKRAELQKDASADALIAQLRAIAGISEDQQAFQARIENQLQHGVTVVPFFLRPKFILPSIRDVPHLWEIAKFSSIDDRKYHLAMLLDPAWESPSAASLRTRVPLLDLTALLVLLDLGLVNSAVNFFGKIAIAKSTLETLAQLTDPFSGSLVSSKCIALQDALKPHLRAIIQPSIADLADGDEGDEEPFGRECTEIKRLCQEQADTFRLYSDDLAFRVLCAESDDPDGICTLDLLGGLEEAGFLTRKEVAASISKLCTWRVGVVVRLKDLLSLMPKELEQAKNLREAIDILDKDVDFTAVTSAVWDFRGPFDKTLRHAAAILRYLADHAALSNIALSALLAQWFVKAGMKRDAPSTALNALTQLVLLAVQPANLSKESSERLWDVYLSLVEFHHGDLMDESREREAVRLLGAECARTGVANGGSGSNLHLSLRQALTAGTSRDSTFVDAYSNTLVGLTTRKRPQ
jgi:tetratricopeptide (TPR) repeat protein